MAPRRNDNQPGRGGNSQQATMSLRGDGARAAAVVRVVWLGLLLLLLLLLF
jgi:hypothetical protein